MDAEPVALVLKFAFLGGLFLFLFWVAASGMRTLRATAGNYGGAAATGGAGDAVLVALGGGGLGPGDRFDAYGETSIGRSPGCDIPITDRFASSLHARVFSGQGGYYLEDMGSTNGTFLNEAPVEGAVPLDDLDVIRIGEASLRFEYGQDG